MSPGGAVQMDNSQTFLCHEPYKGIRLLTVWPHKRWSDPDAFTMLSLSRMLPHTSVIKHCVVYFHFPHIKSVCFRPHHFQGRLRCSAPSECCQVFYWRELWSLTYWNTWYPLVMCISNQTVGRLAAAHVCMLLLSLFFFSETLLNQYFSSWKCFLACEVCSRGKCLKLPAGSLLAIDTNYMADSMLKAFRSHWTHTHAVG